MMSHTDTQTHPAARAHPHRLGAGLLAALLLAAPAAEAITRCGSAAEQAIFEVQALKTELMVVATACREETRYNAFVERYRAELLAADRGMGQHFARTKGRTGQRAHDAYVTNLANARATEAQRLGSDHCPRNVGLFGEVMALPQPRDIADYAAGKDMVPASLGACEPPPPVRATPARTPTRSAATRTTPR